MNRRLLNSPDFNLETYPFQPYYIPDVLVAIVALKLYSQQNGGIYDKTVDDWLANMKENHLSNINGIIASRKHRYRR
ncbi:MAG: hypothetical protein J6U22_02750 [Bacteroidaceae bacterium]|nr:hypothetical protein [Bacteroidaceae bacterium]